jgi:serine/threonine protein kinase
VFRGVIAKDRATVEMKKRFGVPPMSLAPELAALPQTSYAVDTHGAEFSLRDFRITGAVVHRGNKGLFSVNEMSLGDIDMDNKVLVSQGASGKVYRTHHLPTGALIALKLIPVTTKEHRDEIASELSVLCRDIVSRYVVKTFGAFYSSDELAVCIPMEWMCMSLHDATMKLRGMPERAVQAVAKHLLLGLRHLHKLNIIHRDIKPRNVLIGFDGVAKISDFGISKAASEDLSAGELVPQVTTAYVGTQHFMAPERLDAGGYSYESDVWAVGLSLVKASAGRESPWHDSDLVVSLMDASEISDRIASGALPGFPPTYSEASQAFLRRCLVVNPRDRGTCEQLLSDPFITSISEDEAANVLLELMARIADPSEVSAPVKVGCDDEPNGLSTAGSQSSAFQNISQKSLANVSFVAVSEAELRDIFAVFDVNGDGYLDQDEFKHAYRSFEHFGHAPSDKEVAALFHRTCGNNERVSFDEFCVLMLKYSRM